MRREKSSELAKSDFRKILSNNQQLSTNLLLFSLNSQLINCSQLIYCSSLFSLNSQLINCSQLNPRLEVLVFLGGIEAGAGFLGIEDVVTHDEGTGVLLPEGAEEME